MTTVEDDLRALRSQNPIGARRQQERPTTAHEIQQRRDEAEAASRGQATIILPPGTVPRQRSSSPWSHDPVPPEPPLGDDRCGDVLGGALGGPSPPPTEEQSDDHETEDDRT